MNAPQQQLQTKTEVAPELKATPQTRLATLYFHDSVMFGTEMLSASVAKTGGNCVDSILPASLDDTGAIITGSDGAQGMVLRKQLHDLHSGKRKLAQTFVPWANIKSVGYSE